MRRVSISSSVCREAAEGQGGTLACRPRGYKNSTSFNFSPRRRTGLFLWLASSDIKVNILILSSLENFLDLIRNEIHVVCLGRKSICFLAEESQALGRE